MQNLQQQNDEDLIKAYKADYKITKPEISIEQDFVNVRYLYFFTCFILLYFIYILLLVIFN